MQSIILLFVIGAVIASIWMASPQKKESALQEQNNTQKTQQISKAAGQIEKNPSPASTVSIETVIKYGPLEKEIIRDTNRIIFNFRAEALPKDAPGQVLYETKLEGFDKDWQTTSYTERIVDLPAGVKDYTFFVRAKIGKVVDPTPAAIHFRLEVSPYFQKLRISGITPPTVFKPSLLNLYSQFSGEKIDITGWQIEGKYGKFIIPQGAEKYDSLNHLFKENIFVKPGDSVYVSSDIGPIFNTNFRPNKCMGYLDDGSRNFVIPVSKICPRPAADRLPRYLSQECQKYINNRSQCESVNIENLKSYNPPDQSSCLSYIETNFTYRGCFMNYSSDSDFLQNSWHIYMNVTDREKEIMDQKKDTVYLKDQNGLIVDKYIYGY
jgi:hypothetical protein